MSEFDVEAAFTQAGLSAIETDPRILFRPGREVEYSGETWRIDRVYPHESEPSVTLKSVNRTEAFANIALSQMPDEFFVARRES